MKNLIFFLLLFFSVTGIAQRVTVSEEVPLRASDQYQVIGKMKNRFLLFKSKTSDVHEIHAFDEKLRLSWKKEIELDRKNAQLIHIIPQKENFVIFYQYRRKGKDFLKAAKYDPAANLIDSTSFADLGSSWYTPRYNLVQSEDRTKVVLYALEKQSFYVLHGFDINTMKSTWSSALRPERILDQNIKEFTLVNNRGHFIYIQEKNNRKSRMDEHRFDVFQVRGEGNQNISSSTIAMNDLLSYDLLWSFDNKNNTLVGAGLYAEKNLLRTNGLFTLRINGNTTTQVHKTEFNSALISKISGRNVDAEKGVEDIDIQEIILRENGNCLVILERNRAFERRIASGGRGYVGPDGGGYIVDYYYDDILAIDLDAEGRITWQEIFHKKQYSQDDGASFSSFFVLKSPKVLRLVFNDEVKNETTVSEYVISASGDSERNSVLSTEAQNIKLRFQNAIQVASREIIVPSERRNRLSLVRIVYN